jgi:hypothetical protein
MKDRSVPRAAKPATTRNFSCLRLSSALLAVATFSLVYRLLETGPGFGEDGLTLLTFTRGDGVCQPIFGESVETCRRDCVEQTEDGRVKVAGFYSDVTRCPHAAEIHYSETVDGIPGLVRDLVKRGKRIRAKGQGHSTGGGFCPDERGAVIVLEQLTG